MSEKANKRGRALPCPEPLSEMPDDLTEPIEALAWLLRETVLRAREVDDFAMLVAFMEKYSMASTRMARLLTSQRELDEEHGMNKALQMALDKVLADMAARGQYP